MKIACYVRVSTAGQNQAGQVAAIKRWLKGNGIGSASVSWFLDKQTGDNLQRPEFEKLQAAIFSGEVETVVVYKLDRLSRKLQDGLNVLCDWCEKGLRVVSVTQQIDFNGTVGKMIASVLFAVSEMGQETRRERQAAGITEAKKRGVYKGRKKGSLSTDTSKVMELHSKGLKATEIATALGINRRTVYRHLKLAPACET